MTEPEKRTAKEWNQLVGISFVLGVVVGLSINGCLVVLVLIIK